MCIDCWSKVAISPGRLNGMQLHIMNNLENLLVFFFRVVILCFIWTAPHKSSIIFALANADSWFISEYRFRAFVHAL